jgi:XRE family transcriptional regulator, regulator of sulfur utilization
VSPQDRQECKRRFGANLRARRLREGLSQEELARRAGLDRTHVSLIECGRREARLSAIYVLARALGIASPELMPSITAENPSE